jgi:hypothetical protein
MLANLIVSGLCLLLLLRIVCKAWRRAFEIPSARDLDKTRDLAARRQQATKDRQRNSPRDSCLESSPSQTLPCQVTKR